MTKKKTHDNAVIAMSKEELKKFCADCFNEMLANYKISLENAIKEETTFLTCKQLEERFQVSHGTIWNWRKAGKLQPVKIGKRVLYRMSDVRHFVFGC